MAYSLTDAYGNTKQCLNGTIIETPYGDFKITNNYYWRKQIGVVTAEEYRTNTGTWGWYYDKEQTISHEQFARGEVKFRGKGKLRNAPEPKRFSKEIWAF